MRVTLGVSNRHVHLTKETYEKLFGDKPLEIVKLLGQPGQFASDRSSYITGQGIVIDGGSTLPETSTVGTK